jgi:hypothetical protein
MRESRTAAAALRPTIVYAWLIAQGSRAALGLLRHGFAIASPRNDAIPDDSRDGHLPCEE